MVSKGEKREVNEVRMEASQSHMRTGLTGQVGEYGLYPEGNWEPWRVLNRGEDQTRWASLAAPVS